MTQFTIFLRKFFEARIGQLEEEHIKDMERLTEEKDAQITWLIEHFEGHIAQLEQRHQDQVCEGRMKKAADQIEFLILKVKKAIEQSDRLKLELAQVTRNNEVLSQSEQRLKSDLRQEVEIQRQHEDRIRKAVDCMESLILNVGEAVAESDLLKCQVSELKRENEALSRSEHGLKSQVADLERKNAELAESKKGLNVEISNLQQYQAIESICLQDEIGELMDEVEEVEKENQRLKSKLRRTVHCYRWRRNSLLYDGDSLNRISEEIEEPVAERDAEQSTSKSDQEAEQSTNRPDNDAEQSASRTGSEDKRGVIPVRQPIRVRCRVKKSALKQRLVFRFETRAEHEKRVRPTMHDVSHHPANKGHS